MNIIDLLKDKEKVKKVLEEVINEKNKKLTEILIPLAQDPQLTYLYALAIIKDKIKDEWEEIILQDHVWTYLYTFNILKKPWSKGEETISQNGWYSWIYAKEILKDRFKKGEKAIIKDKDSLKKYISFLKSIKKLKEFLKDYPEVKFFDR